MTKRQKAEQIASLINSGNQTTVQSADQIEGKLNEYTVVTVDDERVIACAQLRRLTWFVAEARHVVVDPEFRRGGIALGIIHILEERAKQLFDPGGGVLIATVVKSNLGANLMMLKLGFNHVGEITSKFTGRKLVAYSKAVTQ